MFRTKFLFSDQKKVNDFILTFKHNPFPAPPASTDYLENPAQFIIGRDMELKKIENVIKESLTYAESKLMFIQGKQGIGKSTIISSIPKYLKNIGLENNVMIVYFNTSNDPSDFNFLNFYQQSIHVLDNTGFLEQLVFASLRKIILLGKKEGGTLANDLNTLSISAEKIEKIEKDPEYLKYLLQGEIPALYTELKRYITKHFRILRKFLKINDFKLLLTLIDSILGNEALDSLDALKGKGVYNSFTINTNNLASAAFNDLKKLTRWVYDEATFLVIFDHLERGLSNPTKVFHSFFSLLLGLRQQKYTSILVSGTLDAFQGLYNILEEDMKLQLDNWSSFYETLHPLSIDSVVNISKRHLDNYWMNSNFRPPHEYDLYPFGKESIGYLYDSTNEDIRKTLIELHKLFNVFKQKQDVDPTLTFFEALVKFGQKKKLSLNSREIKYLKSKLLDPSVQDKVRSTIAENALVKLLEIVRKLYPDITELKHEPPIGKKGLKPDVYFELFGGLTLKKLKKVGIEVKIFRVSNEVPKKEVEKTHSLIEQNDLDYVSWVTTVPLSQVKHQLNNEHKAKVGNTIPLTDEKQAYLSFSIHFEEIFKRKPDAQESLFLLKKIGIDIVGIMNYLQPDEKIDVTQAVESPEVKPQIDDLTTISPTEPVNEERKPIQVANPLKSKQTTKLFESPKPIQKTTYEQANDIKNKISEIITKKSLSSKYANKSTIVGQIIKPKKYKTLTQEEREDFDAIIDEIAKKKGFEVKPTRIYF